MPTEPEVKYCFFYFKKALWHVVESVCPGVERRGSVFHWGNAVLKKIKLLGLKVAYIGKKNYPISSEESSLPCPFFLENRYPRYLTLFLQMSMQVL